MVKCNFCNKEIKKKGELLIKPSVGWVHPTFPYTVYHLSCYKEGNLGIHGPITFFKNKRFGLTYLGYVFAPVILFSWFYVLFLEPLWFVPAGAFLVFNLWIMLRIRKVVKSLK
jgi:hypothetical protein